MSYQITCINCGNPVKELYKKYSASVLKISECEKCNQVADKYIEFEPIIILIDLILLSGPAYRHVLYNSQFQIKWKLTVVMLLLESYILSKDIPHVNDEYFSAEKIFYFSFLLTLIDKILLFLLLRIFSLTLCLNRNNNDDAIQQTAASNKSTTKETSISFFMIKAIILAGIAKFFLIPIVIWNSNQSELEILLHWILASVYYGLAIIHVYSVLLNCSRKHSAVIVVLSMLVKALLFNEINGSLGQYFEINL